MYNISEEARSVIPIYISKLSNVVKLKTVENQEY